MGAIVKKKKKARTYDYSGADTFFPPTEEKSPEATIKLNLLLKSQSENAF